ncbi:hypothetical protein A5821_002543 [Enterococcus sp. 7F3_DIV0205]|uniref:Uncharacterized protein n=1 Tax=Candidatus Enterococcus palustris TaxID=1834189 RepID=A0AAQ3Y853_9ENTE|nr:hypothetical protein [Enterococcus sp. 7F3_DIV0205]OTN82974.1 hypothetical protein A5821_002897 [Enterococcus sp. 7F3_DIV0205]
MGKTQHTSTFGINLAIVIYYFLPRIQITTASPYWNVFFNSRSILVFLFTIAMLVITFQKTYSNKWQNIRLGEMVGNVYLLYVLASFFYIMIVELI